MPIDPEERRHAPHIHVIDREGMIYQSSLTPGTSLNGMDATDIVGTLAGEYIDAADVLRYLKAVETALDEGNSHCSFHIEGVRLFALMTRMSSMRVRVRDWPINSMDDLIWILNNEA